MGEEKCELAREGELNFAKPIERAALRDGRLSWGARGLFFFLWDMPLRWGPRLNHLAKMGPEGRDAVRSRLAELEAVKAIRIEPIRLPDGTLAGKRWVLRAPNLWAQEFPLKADDQNNGFTEDRQTRPSVNSKIGKPDTKVHQFKGSSRIKVSTTTPPAVDLGGGEVDFSEEELMKASCKELEQRGQKMGERLKLIVLARYREGKCNSIDIETVKTWRQAHALAAMEAAAKNIAGKQFLGADGRVYSVDHRGLFYGSGGPLNKVDDLFLQAISNGEFQEIPS